MRIYKRGAQWWIDYLQNGKRVRYSLETDDRSQAVKLFQIGLPENTVSELSGFATEYSVKRYMNYLELHPELPPLFTEEFERTFKSPKKVARKHPPK